ncbi:MAG TPA: GNAT family N-acetyltransferase [Planctomycetota bacterium]|nr:GNAT family N-acetyltransferase [Planctomycetota bacterium]
MKITVLNARDLAPAHWDRWRILQGENPDLDSPYFCADYVRIVGSIREDVFVAVLGSPGEPSGFFPFQRSRLGFGMPVGGRLSDFHGVIAPRGTTLDVSDLMRASGLVSWEFHALPVSQSAFAPHHAQTMGSHFVDTSKGLPGFEEEKRRAGSQQPRMLRSYRRRVLERFKKVEFVPHVTDTRVLDTLLEWKSRQYQESGSLDNWSIGWMRDLMRKIHAHQGEEFSGALSALFLDGELAVAHMGMRSRTAWHWWIPRHDEKFNDTHPGLLLLSMMIEEAPRFGVTRLDLGYGDEKYKLNLRSGEIPVARGRIELPSLAVSLRRWREGLETWVRGSRLLPVMRFPGRIFKRLEAWNRSR